MTEIEKLVALHAKALLAHNAACSAFSDASAAAMHAGKARDAAGELAQHFYEQIQAARGSAGVLSWKCVTPGAYAIWTAKGWKLERMPRVAGKALWNVYDTTAKGYAVAHADSLAEAKEFARDAAGELAQHAQPQEGL